MSRACKAVKPTLMSIMKLLYVNCRVCKIAMASSHKFFQYYRINFQLHSAQLDHNTGNAILSSFNSP